MLTVHWEEEAPALTDKQIARSEGELLWCNREDEPVTTSQELMITFIRVLVKEKKLHHTDVELYFSGRKHDLDKDGRFFNVPKELNILDNLLFRLL